MQQNNSNKRNKLQMQMSRSAKPKLLDRLIKTKEKIDKDKLTNHTNNYDNKGKF